MTIGPYSTYAAYLANVGGFQRLQTSLATLTQQLNSGVKSSDLTTYGVEAQRLVELRAEIVRRQGYMEAIKNAEPDVQAYDRIFSRMETLNADMAQAFTSPMTDPPTSQQHTVRFEGDIGDTGDVYRIVIDGVLFSYVTSGVEGSFDEIAGNLAAQINAHQPPLRGTAEAIGDRIVITAREPGPIYNVTASKAEAAGGNANNIVAALSRAGKFSSITQRVDNALVELGALLNETINDRYLFGGASANELAPVVDLTRLPDPSNPANAAGAATTRQLAAGTILQTVRVTTDYLGSGQSETINVNGTPTTFNGPLTQQQLALAMANAVGLVPGVTVQDVDATGFTIKSTTPGTAFTIAITGNDPTPSTYEIAQANVPIGAQQTDIVTLSGPVGLIGEVFSVTITNPPVHGAPVTLSYRTTGEEPDLNTIVQALIGQITDYLPPFSVTATNLGNGQMQLSGATALQSHATVQNVPSVVTTQRTVVPVAQQNEVSFPGPLDVGDVYSLTFTTPAAGPFSVTTQTGDTTTSMATRLANTINASAIGVTASASHGKLVLTAGTPGTAFVLTTAITTDAGPNVSAPPVSTNVVANIVAGPLRQIDEVRLSGPVGRIGDVYEVTVNGRTVRYSTTGSERDIDAIAINLTALINAQVPAFPASAVPGPTGSGKLILTASIVGVELETEAQVARPVSVGDPLAPDYNAHQAPSDSALAWERRNLAIADQMTLRYTFSANEIAFQKLALAFRWAQSAVADTEHYFEKMETARALAKESLAGIRALAAENAVTDAMFGATQLSHQTAINATLDGTDKIEMVDPNEVAAKLQSVQVQLQASFATVAATNRLSLINFLA